MQHATMPRHPGALFRAHRRTNKSPITGYVTVTMLLFGMMVISIAFLLGAVYVGRS
jgi:hypothetical protein